MDNDAMRAAFLAGYTCARTDRLYGDLPPLSRRTAEDAYRRWDTHRTGGQSPRTDR